MNEDLYDDELKQFLKDHAAGKFANLSDASHPDLPESTISSLHEQPAIQSAADQQHDFLRLIVRARLNKGWTQADLARAIGSSRPTIARIETGRISPSLKTVLKIAQALGMQLYLK